MATKNLNIAILVADTPPLPVVEAGGGDYAHLFANLFHSAAKNYRSQSISIKTQAFDVVHKQEYPQKLDGVFDAVLITGSAASAYEDKPWILRLVQYVQDISKNTPMVKIIGICFGHQIVARAFGGRVAKNELGWEVGSTEMRLTEEGRKLLHTDKTKMIIMSMHQDHVADVPAGFVVLSSTDICPVQAMLCKGATSLSSSPLPSPSAATCRVPVITIQGHPEYTPPIVAAFLRIRLEKGIFKKEFVDEALAVLERPNEDRWFTENIIHFLLDAEWFSSKDT